MLAPTSDASFGDGHDQNPSRRGRGGMRDLGC